MKEQKLPYLSLSDLLKKSAKAICYFRNKRKNFPVTERQIQGNKHAELKTISEFAVGEVEIIPDEV